IGGCRSVLDIGAGTGLLSLICAQRSKADIIGIELDSDAARQAMENAAQSPWNTRINIIEGTFQGFSAQTQLRFDAVISNPPYFQSAHGAKNAARTAARLTGSLSYQELIQDAARILSPDGSFFCIIPAPEREAVCALARASGLYPSEICTVLTRAGKKPERVLCSFSRENAGHRETELIIHSEGNNYSQAYRALTRDLYLAF
ncbi:MAG: tRNA1(Val) (adenine(37)-N6)-methyltransferase, partial [Spirochaetota bacterium]